MVLELIGAFSITQESIDNAALMYFRKKTPCLATFVRKNAFARLRDDERPGLLAALADELEVPADRSNFKMVFNRVKMLRDFVAHAAVVELVDEDSVQIVRNFHVGPDNPESPIKAVTRIELEARLHDCRWLSQHVNYLLARSELVVQTYIGDQQIEFVDPSAKPEDWNGREYRPLDAAT